MFERTLVLIKPDAVRRGLIGEILTRYERKGLAILAMDQRQVDPALSDAHYAEHIEKPFYPALREFITGGEVIALQAAEQFERYTGVRPTPEQIAAASAVSRA